MATITQVFEPGDAILPASNPAAPVQFAGTNFPVPGLAFDASTQEIVFFPFYAVSYGSGNLSVQLLWYADTASTGTLTMDAAVAAITPNTDTQDIETKAFATANSGNQAHLGTTNQRLHSFTITVSNLDSIAAGDYVILRIRRTTGGLSGDAILTKVILTYSD